MKAGCSQVHQNEGVSHTASFIPTSQRLEWSDLRSKSSVLWCMRVCVRALKHSWANIQYQWRDILIFSYFPNTMTVWQPPMLLLICRKISTLNPFKVAVG